MNIEVNVANEPNIFNVAVHDGNPTPPVDSYPATKVLTGYHDPTMVEPGDPRVDTVFIRFPNFAFYRWSPEDHEWALEFEGIAVPPAP